jgi:hypothetical protein
MAWLRWNWLGLSVWRTLLSERNRGLKKHSEADGSRRHCLTHHTSPLRVPYAKYARDARDCKDRTFSNQELRETSVGKFLIEGHDRRHAAIKGKEWTHAAQLLEEAKAPRAPAGYRGPTQLLWIYDVRVAGAHRAQPKSVHSIRNRVVGSPENLTRPLRSADTLQLKTTEVRYQLSDESGSVRPYAQVGHLVVAIRPACSAAN